jgi:hypothetical protein
MLFRPLAGYSCESCQDIQSSGLDTTPGPHECFWQNSVKDLLQAAHLSSEHVMSNLLNGMKHLYRAITLPVLYGCETWSLTLKGKLKLRVFENRMLIFRPKRDEVTGERRGLHNKELYDLYSSQNIIRMIKSRRLRSARHVACIEARKGA